MLQCAGTYKPQIHTHYLPHLSLSYARHTNSLNQTFILLSSDYTKSLHLQSDRFLEFHTPGGLHYTTRIPRYGRDLKFNRRNAEALVPAVGVNAEGNGEVFRLNLEVGRFMKGFEIDVGGDDLDSFGGGALQGGVNTGAVNCAAIAEESHGLLAFGTSKGTVEFWDSRSRNRVSVIDQLDRQLSNENIAKSEISAVVFQRSGMNFAVGDSNGTIRTFDLRSPTPLLKKSQGYDFPIQNLMYLDSSMSSSKILSSDKKCIKIWDSDSGSNWATVEPAVDLNHVEWVPSSGMFLTANEGRQQHAIFIPQLGPAPRWCAFLDSLVEEMAEDFTDPSAFKNTSTAGDVYENYKFLDMKQLRDLSLDHLIGTTKLLRPYMHGYFVAQKLYEQARLLTNPEVAEEQRQKSIQEKINKERESRIRGSKKVSVKVNRKYAETLAAREEANERRKMERIIRQGGDVAQSDTKSTTERDEKLDEPNKPLLDDRFKGLFENKDFEIDETSREFALHNPSSVPTTKASGLTAVDRVENDDEYSNSDADSESGSDLEENASELRQRQRQRNKQDFDAENTSKGRIGASSYSKGGKRPQNRGAVNMRVSSASNGRERKPNTQTSQTFGDLASSGKRRQDGNGRDRSFKQDEVLGEREISFVPSKSKKKTAPTSFPSRDSRDEGRAQARGKERRSASGNVFRRM